MSLDGISGFHQVGHLWVPDQPTRKGKETINFSEEFRKEQIRQRVKDKIAKMPQPQLTAEAQAAYNNAQQASDVWTQNKNLVPTQPKKIGGAVRNARQTMYDRLFEAEKPIIRTTVDPLGDESFESDKLKNTKPSRQERLREIRNNPEKRARYNRLKLAQNPLLKARYERFIQAYAEPIIINPVEDNFEAAQNTKPSRQERLKEIRNNPEKRARYNRLKLAQNPELKARYERFSNFKKTKGITGGLKKAGKWGAVAALAIGAGALALNFFKKDDKPAEAETPTNTETVPETQETETQTTPAAPVEADEPTPVDETETSNAAGAVVEPGAGNAAEHATENEAGNTTGNVENSEQTSETIVQNGDTLEEVANRYGVTVEKLKELNADKIKKFRTADGKVIEGFRVGENISLQEDAKKVEGLKGKDEAIAEYEKELIENFENIPQAMWNQLCTPEFRKKHKLGEYKEAA